jgi:hypothetical protein
MPDLWDHGGFHLDFKGKPERPAMYCGVRIPEGSPERAMHEAGKVKPEMQWRSW